MRILSISSLVSVAAMLVLAAAEIATAEPKHGLAMHGEPALAPGFEHFPYVNPQAPKGGSITYGFVGTFDSLNPFVVRGNAPRGIWDGELGNNIVEPLMARSKDEPFTLYGLVARSVETDEERSFVAFDLDPRAAFADGHPITPEDVIFTAELLKEKGRPGYRNRLGKVASIKQVGERRVRFDFTEEADRELPLLLAMLPVLPAHATDRESFADGGLKPLLGSGPYEITEVEPGRRYIMRRRDDYWAKDLPTKRGQDNFDEIRMEYYRDSSSHFEAFKKGLFDVLPESDPGRWTTGYDFPAAEAGDVVRDVYESGSPRGMHGLVMNARRKPFDDPRVRRAMTYFLDFEWLNKNLFFDQLRRTSSFFEGSELSAVGVPMSEGEKTLLGEDVGAIEADVADGSYRPPRSDGSGRDRKMLRQGLRLLMEAGYERRGGKLVDTQTGQPLRFEMLVRTREQERIGLAFQRALQLVGIDLSIRQADSTQFWDRLKTFDYDMIPFVYTASLSPGIEQNNRWSSEAADIDGTFNFAGARSEAIDRTIERMVAARDRESFNDAVRALDRLLISGHYLIPLFHQPGQWLARRARIEVPDVVPLYGYQPTTWWSAEAAD